MSQALEDLEQMVQQVFQADGEFELYYNKVKQHILKAQEQEKVLEIIKEKSLSLLVFKSFKLYDKDGVLELDYQYFVDCHKAISEEFDEEAQEQVATQEEFELLKRYFEKNIQK